MLQNFQEEKGNVLWEVPRYMVALWKLSGISQYPTYVKTLLPLHRWQCCPRGGVFSGS